MSEETIVFLFGLLGTLGVASWISYEMKTQYPKYMSRGRLILGFCLVIPQVAIAGLLMYWWW